MTVDPALLAPPAVDPPVPPAPAPPWGDNFDPQTAWTLINGLREDKAKLQARAISPEQQEQLEQYERLVELSRTDQERLEEAASQAKQYAYETQAEAFRWKAAALHGIPADNIDLLGSGTEEEVTARAERLSNLLKAAAPPATIQPPSGRPIEQLKPGATPSGTVDEDDALYNQLFPSQ